MISKNKKYIIIGAMGGYISGAPIYHRNKAQYMKSLGWDVYCISCREGKIFVEGLERFVVGTFPILTILPFTLPRKQCLRIIDDMAGCIPCCEGEIVIETGTFYTAYWGEMLAQKLKARHIVIYLDEHNFGIQEGQAEFFKFKYDREELACIGEVAYKDIFSGFWNLEEKRIQILPCFCQNSLEDVPSSIIVQVKCSDITIGYVGRLEKAAFKALVNGMTEFSIQHSHLEIALNCFGDFDRDEDRSLFLTAMSKLPNVQTYITGYIFPIPMKAIQKCDLFFASAGSVTVSVKACVPTIGINVYSNLPDGFRMNVDKREYMQLPNRKTVCDYLNAFFIDGIRPPKCYYKLDKDKELMCTYFRKHVNFLQKSLNKPMEFYNIFQLSLSFKEKLKKYIISLIGYINYVKIRKLAYFLKCKNKYSKSKKI